VTLAVVVLAAIAVGALVWRLRVERRASDEARKRLLAAVSHELRSPLQRLRFATELLAGGDPAERAALAEKVQRDLDALDALVAELLTWIKLDAGPAIRRAPVALARLAREAADDAARLGAVIELDAPELTIAADPRLLRRAVDNLLTNAVKYGRGRVLLSLRREPRAVAIRVDDDGPGIAPESRARVLEPFVRLEASRTREQGGVGLGLALVDGIARAHGGTVRIGESRLGGARVSIVLPLTDADVA
jgi:signal transduction histidine kinase